MRGGVVKRGRSTRSHVPCVGRDNDGGMRPNRRGFRSPTGAERDEERDGCGVVWRPLTPRP